MTALVATSDHKVAPCRYQLTTLILGEMPLPCSGPALMMSVRAAASITEGHHTHFVTNAISIK